MRTPRELRLRMAATPTRAHLRDAALASVQRGADVGRCVNPVCWPSACRAFRANGCGAGQLITRRAASHQVKRRPGSRERHVTCRRQKVASVRALLPMEWEWVRLRTQATTACGFSSRVRANATAILGQQGRHTYSKGWKRKEFALRAATKRALGWMDARVHTALKKCCVLKHESSHELPCPRDNASSFFSNFRSRKISAATKAKTNVTLRGSSCHGSFAMASCSCCARASVAPHKSSILRTPRSTPQPHPSSPACGLSPLLSAL